MSLQPVRTSEDAIGVETLETLGDMQTTWEDIVQTSALFEEQHADDEQYYDLANGSITYDAWVRMVDLSEREAIENGVRDSDGDSIPDLVETGPDYPFSEPPSTLFNGQMQYQNKTFPLTYDGLMQWHEKEKQLRLNEQEEQVRIEKYNMNIYDRAYDKVMALCDNDPHDEDSDEEFERMRLENEEYSAPTDLPLATLFNELMGCSEKEEQVRIAKYNRDIYDRAFDKVMALWDIGGEPPIKPPATLFNV